MVTGGQVKLLWRYQADGSIHGPVTAQDGKVYVTSRGGTVTALDGSTGQQLWQTKIDPSPISAGVTVAGLLYTGTVDGTLAALVRLAGTASGSSGSAVPFCPTPAYGGSMLFAGASDNHLYGLDAETGRIRWQSPTAALVRARPVYAHGKVYVGTWGGEVLAFDARTGALHWRTRTATNVYLAPANVPLMYYRGRIYATNSTGGSHTTGMQALNARDGRVLWQAPETAGYSSPYLMGAELVANAPGGRLFAVNPLTGKRTWSGQPGFFDLWLLRSAPGRRLRHDHPARSGAGRDTGRCAVALRHWRYLCVLPGWSRRQSGVRGYHGRLALRHCGACGACGAAHRLPRHRQPLGGGHHRHRSPAWPCRRIRRWHLQTGWAGNPGRAGIVDCPLPGRRRSLPTFQSNLTDLEGHWAAPVILALEEQKIVGGRPGPDGGLVYDPGASVTRAEAAAMLARMVGRTGASAAFMSRFADLTGHWAAGTVGAVEEIGLIAGYMENGNLLFKPDGTITHAEAVTLLMRAAMPGN